ncbi:hypothetical protein V1505DRAFT_358143 [Lipomyces doorenjongii]
MAPSDKKTIVVDGAIGNQGSSVAHTFLDLTNWHVRCVTRNPSSLSAPQALIPLGGPFENDPCQYGFLVDMSHAILQQRVKEEEEIRLAPSEIAFDQEVLHGKNAAFAAAEVQSLERFVYSALSPIKHSR